MNPRVRFLNNLKFIGLALALIVGQFFVPTVGQSALAFDPASDDDPPVVTGPFVETHGLPARYDGDLRDLPQLPASEAPVPVPLRYVPGQEPKGSAPQVADWIDAVAQTAFGSGQMPSPIANFAGLDLSGWGSGWPPDTNGDVGPTYYIQTVNTSIGIYDKATGVPAVRIEFNDFFTGPIGTPCDNSNRGDPVVLYDPYVDRWVITDFAWVGSSAPYYECIAVSQTNDPVSGGWYFYALRADTGGFLNYLNDYPKLGVWDDGWYMSANMFGTSFGVRVWALDRASMIGGGPLNEVHFDTCMGGWCDSLLPSNVRGDLPPAGAPNYFASVSAPNTFRVWEFDVDWSNPGAATFTGPVDLTIADFAIAPSIPQKNTSQLLDSLSFRLMMQLQYRNIDGRESLWANHSVTSGGVVGVRWYEIGDPGGAPFVAQQSTYQPDDLYRWMGSVAVDQDGNMAVGYSVSSDQMFPAIRYAGRLAGEIPGRLPQDETVLIQGTGSQTGISRWGDYSAMTVDPLDDCTFWYTTEYYITTGSNWQTRIGSFKFPSCGAAKGYLEGYVRNAVTSEPVPGAIVVAQGVTQTLTVMADISGYYTMTLVGDSYDLTANSELPGYPTPANVPNVAVTTGNVTIQDIFLAPVPFLVDAMSQMDDSGPYGNGNGFPEPGEQGMLLWQGVRNTGAITSTNVEAFLTTSSAGVTIETDTAAYPDIVAGEIQTNTTAYVFSVADDVVCGADLDFQHIITDSVATYLDSFTLNASIPLPRANVFFNDVEGGPAGWTTGGSPNTWNIVTSQSHSPTHSWTDSPAGNYQNNTNSFLRSPAYNLSGFRKIEISGWVRYALEPGYDYVYLEYSLNGGGSWNTASPLTFFNGYQPDWAQFNVSAPMLDGQPNVAIRFRLVSDGGVVDDGIYIDDIAMSYEPFTCDYAPPSAPGAPTLLTPPDGGVSPAMVSFSWEDSGLGDPAEGYTLTVDGAPLAVFTTPVTSTVIALPVGAHDWYVTAFNALGASPASETWSFTIQADLPGAPNLLTPADGSTVINPVAFSWEDSGLGASPEGYTLTVDGAPAMVFTTPVTSTEMTLDAGDHTWSVTAFTAAGASPASETFTFTVAETPGIPLLVSPEDGILASSTLITFTWAATTTGPAPTGFIFILDGAPVMTFTTPVTSAALTLTPGAHTWTVQAVNAAGISAAAEPRTIWVPYQIYLSLVYKD